MDKSDTTLMIRGEDMSGKVQPERMAEIRRGSKLRQRLQMEIEEATQSVHLADDNIRYHYQQLSYVQAYEADPVKRRHNMAFWQSSINQLHAQMTMLHHRLAVAVQDLHDFEEATAEVSERANREPKSRESGAKAGRCAGEGKPQSF